MRMSKMKSKFVFDSSAFLALVNNEKGSNIAETYISSSYISTVNVSEIVSILSSIKVPESDYKHIIRSLVSEIIPFDEKQAYICGALREQTRSKGLSLGDRACLSLAKTLDLPAITADKVWGDLNLGIEVIQIR